jgi:hypothetical protein
MKEISNAKGVFRPAEKERMSPPQWQPNPKPWSSSPMEELPLTLFSTYRIVEVMIKPH